MDVEKMTWRFLDSGKGSAMFNMAADVYFLAKIAEGNALPIFRVYQWSPPAVSIGYAQPVDDTVNLAKCARHGIDAVRRPTGGRAVLHDNELAYSVIAPVTDTTFGGGILDTYRSISSLLCAALKTIGVDASLTPGVKKTGTGSNRLPCFMSTSYHEVTVGGKKLIGSAQRRIGSVFLQHGSILLGPGHERIFEYSVNVNNAARLLRLLKAGSTDLESETGSPVTADILISAIYDTLHSLPGVSVTEQILSDTERTDIETEAVNGNHDISGGTP